MLKLDESDGADLEAISDSNWAGDPGTRKLTTLFVAFFVGGTISSAYGLSHELQGVSGWPQRHFDALQDVIMHFGRFQRDFRGLHSSTGELHGVVRCQCVSGHFRMYQSGHKQFCRLSVELHGSFNAFNAFQVVSEGFRETLGSFTGSQMSFTGFSGMFQALQRDTVRYRMFQ